ncbi:MAG: OB-fold nucleic acid binding domain-containing protein [Haloarculaceae archaeon]
MGTCIICGTSVDGHICDLHEQDVVFEFRGTQPNQLGIGRYYRGTVDGFAEFGVFVDIGESVTGLLHRSELDQRLDSLDWEPGDEVFVQVKNVRDNGNVDLAWSIRQDASEFRGTLVDDPEFDHARLKSEVDGEGEGSDVGGDAGGTETGAETAGGSGTEAETDTEDEAGNRSSADGTTTGDVSRADGEDRSDRSAGVVGEGSTESETGSGAVVAEAAEDEAVETAADESAETAADESAETAADESAETAAAEGAETEPDESAESAPEGDRERVGIATLESVVGKDVRLEGEVVGVRQTSGPTVFEIRDETGAVDCAAFVEAGVRAYPEVVEGDVVRLDGEVRERRGELQVETAALEALEDEERTAVEERLAAALEERARPAAVAPLADDDAVAALSDELVDAATAIRRAVITDRPVIVRHAATADGYVGGVALERATLPLVREEHRQADAEYHYFDRRPLEGGVYDMDDATKDTTTMLENRERHDETVPLFVFVAAGGSKDSLDGLELLDIYDAPRVVVDDVHADDEVRDVVDTVVSPSLVEGADTTAAALAANVAAHVDERARDYLAHLPAVSFWDEVPEAYLEAAADAGYDAGAVRDLREAIALEAHYQSYEDKRELITDLLFGDDEEDVTGLASNVAEQFRDKVDTEVETASANLDVQTLDGTDVAVLDVEAFTHRFDFPPETLLLDELFRREDASALVGVGEDTIYVRRSDAVDVYDLADAVAERVPDAGVKPRSAREGSLRFLAGRRSAVLEATLDALAERI